MAEPNDFSSAHPWIRKAWCVRTALGLLLLGFFSNLLFLYHHCPFDLSEDESQYWLWSRHLAWGYYSKGPGIAGIIYAATAVGHWFGQHATMPIIRTPAIIFAFFSGLASLLLARRMFRDDRAGLMVIALSAGVPVFAVGSLIPDVFMLGLGLRMSVAGGGTAVCGIGRIAAATIRLRRNRLALFIRSAGGTGHIVQAGIAVHSSVRGSGCLEQSLFAAQARHMA